jgi:hypothetical protein
MIKALPKKWQWGEGGKMNSRGIEEVVGLVW